VVVAGETKTKNSGVRGWGEPEFIISIYTQGDENSNFLLLHATAWEVMLVRAATFGCRK